MNGWEATIAQFDTTAEDQVVKFCSGPTRFVRLLLCDNQEDCSLAAKVNMYCNASFLRGL
jgi:hypothetical protein